MISALAAIFGALTGLVPAILQFFTLKATNAHQLEIRKLEIQAARENIALQVDLTRAQSDVKQQEHIYSFANSPSGIKWIDALAVLVRPYITLVIFHMWALIEIALFVAAVNGGLRLDEIVPIIWDENSKSTLAAIIGFWFGNRMLAPQMTATLSVTEPKKERGR
jgi:hypothetical protein